MDWYCDVCGDSDQLADGQTQVNCVNGHTIDVDDDGTSRTQEV